MFKKFSTEELYQFRGLLEMVEGQDLKTQIAAVSTEIEKRNKEHIKALGSRSDELDKAGVAPEAKIKDLNELAEKLDAEKTN